MSKKNQHIEIKKPKEVLKYAKRNIKQDGVQQSSLSQYRKDFLSVVAHHESAHLLVYMLELAMTTNKEDFVKRCLHTINSVTCNVINEPNVNGKLMLRDGYQIIGENSIMYLIAGSLGQKIYTIMSLDKYTYGDSRYDKLIAFLKSYFRIIDLDSVFSNFGGSKDYQMIQAVMCNNDEIDLNNSILKTIKVFSNETFFFIWEDVSKWLSFKETLYRDDIKIIAQEHLENFYKIIEEISQKEDKKSFFENFWHGFCNKIRKNK